MARTLESYDWPRDYDKRAKYPWDKWLNGEIWLLESDDFDSKPVSFRQHVYSQAGKKGCRVRISDTGQGGFVIQAIPKRQRDNNGS